MVKLMPTQDILDSMPRYIIEKGVQALAKEQRKTFKLKRPTKKKKKFKAKRRKLTMSEQHAKYLKSNKWMHRKEAYKKTLIFLAGCAGCGTKESLNIHHRHYETVGKEEDIDLLPLCNECHDKVHGAPDRTTNRVKMRRNEILLGIN